MLRDLHDLQGLICLPELHILGRSGYESRRKEVLRMSTPALQDLAEHHRGEVAVAVAYPSQTAAAKMIGISDAQLSRSSFPAHRAGGRGKHYAPRVVLEAAADYRRRSLNEVAGELIAYAEESAPEYKQRVREEVEEFFANRPAPAIDPDKFLEEARQTLPSRLYAHVKRAYEQGRRDDLALNFASEEHGEREAATASG